MSPGTTGLRAVGTLAMADPEPGICPACEGREVAATPCAGLICRLRGYHHIPSRFFAEIAAKRSNARDPRIGQLIDDYLLVGLLGRGGFGQVYLALQLPVMMQVALKLIRATEMAPPMVAHFRRKFDYEALSLGRLAHPNIVRLLRYGCVGDDPYMVIEYVAGGQTLKDVIRLKVSRETVFEPPEVLHLIGQLLDGLEAAHQCQIAHRDIKPENIMVQRIVGNDQLVKILDFGLAKFVGANEDASIVVGTPAYMAPEQITRKHIGPWTDLYAVGVLLFEMITGRRPYGSGTSQEIFSRKLDPTFDPLGSVSDRALPTAVCRLLRRALARSIEKRFMSAAEFRRTLQEVFEQVGDDQSLLLTAPDLTQLLDSTKPGVPSDQVLSVEVTVKSVEVLPPSAPPPQRRRDLPMQLLAICAALLALGALGLVSKLACSNEARRHPPPRRGLTLDWPTVPTPTPLLVSLPAQENRRATIPRRRELVPAPGRPKTVEIVPVYRTQRRHEVVDGVRIKLNGQQVGVTRNSRGVPVVIPAKPGQATIELSGEMIRAQRFTLSYRGLKTRRLEITITLDLR